MKVVLVLLTSILWSSYAQRDNCMDVLQTTVDCFDTLGPCNPLPLPNEALGPPIDPNKGYRIQTLQSNLYAVGEGTYFFLVAIAQGSSERCEKNRAAGARQLEDGKYGVIIVDFPEGSFVIRDETGAVVGSLITTALDEILFDMNNLTPADVSLVHMVYR